MGVVTTIVAPCLRARIYAEGAALPYRGHSVLNDIPWGDGLHFMTIVTNQTPAGNMGRGHFDTVIDGDRIRFAKDRDV